MGWLISCSDTSCGKQTWAGNIVDLIAQHLDADGWLLCSCRKAAYIRKPFELQEPGESPIYGASSRSAIQSLPINLSCSCAATNRPGP
jgi:hypothetical protein